MFLSLMALLLNLKSGLAVSSWMDRQRQSVAGGYSGRGHNLTPDINQLRLVNRTTCL